MIPMLLLTCGRRQKLQVSTWQGMAPTSALVRKKIPPQPLPAVSAQPKPSMPRISVSGQAESHRPKSAQTKEKNWQSFCALIVKNRIKKQNNNEVMIAA